SDYNNTCIYDISDANFTISTPPPYITVTAPNSATTLYVGNSTNITWTSGYLTSSFVTIEYSYNNDTTWNVLANVTENDGTYSWTVPNTVSWQCKVRISEYNNPAVSDVSNVNFFIVMPYITVTAPNGGESWKGCSSKSVTWTGAGISGYYTVKYTTNGGSSWSTLTSNTTSTSYTWNPVPSINSSNCYIMVYDYNNSAYKDSSNAAFTLVKNTDIAVTVPNGAENWVVGSSQNITWISEPTSTAFAVYYSVNNGSSWTSINSYTTVKTQAWTIPNNPSTLSLVKISDYNNTCIYDISDANFTISTPPPYITVTAPNSATTLYVGNSTNITWT
ncbi:MAG: hypothetical protein HY738_18710, partial [Bacteroidia bacterium]|nr:hypothetical protein [Bacteroidia bacterium]